MSVDIDASATPDLLLLIQQKVHVVQYWYGSLSGLIIMKILISRCKPVNFVALL